MLLNQKVPESLEGLRLDRVLATLFPDYSRCRLQSWIQAGHVQVEGKCLRSKDKVKAGQLLSLTVTLQAQSTWSAQALPLNVVYEDTDLLVINKPVGLVVHPGAGNPDHTLVNALLHYAPELSFIPRAGIVHRLDKDTSGLLVIARTLTAHRHLIAQIQARTVQREYVAIVKGDLIAGGTLRAPIRRHPTQRLRMCVHASGKMAITHHRMIERFGAYTTLQVFLETGRTHQIRVHMAHQGYPLVGDKLYGYHLHLPAQCSPLLKCQLSGFKRQALHAKTLTFIHPTFKEEVHYKAPIPEDMLQLIQALRTERTKELACMRS